MEMRMFNTKKIFAVVILSFVANFVNASEWVLDSFDDYVGPNELSVGVVTPDDFDQTSAVSPHGSVVATVVADDFLFNGLSSTAIASGGSLIYNSGSLVSRLGLFYTNPDPQAAPLDLASQGSEFYFDVSQIDLSFSLDLYVFTGLSVFSQDLYDGLTTIDAAALEASTVQFSKATVSPSNEINPFAGDVPERITANFNQFSAYNGGADFSSVSAIFAVISGDVASDLIVDEVGIVPEPTSLAIFGLSLLGLAVARRRKV